MAEMTDRASQETTSQDTADTEKMSPTESESMSAQASEVNDETQAAEAMDNPDQETESAAMAAAETGEVMTQPQGPTEAQQQLLASLSVKGTPPELNNEVWLNSDPLKLSDLRGKVVIVEFWTFG